jgi:serine/threonine protein kinase
MARASTEEVAWTAPGPQQEESMSSEWGAGTCFSTYEIESRLSTGGMAELWRATTKGVVGFERRIVIKTMLTTLQQESDLVEMFIREASLAARLSHPNIVDVIDFGQIDGRYFIAMEYVPGLSLRVAQKQLVARGERLAVPAALHIMRDVCEALEHVHELEDADGPLGLIHCDLSPENVVVETNGTSKLIDFGAARPTARAPVPRRFVGKVRYAAPEQIRLERDDCRSDIYSAGVVLYECLTGSRAFKGSDADVVKAVLMGSGCDPRVRVPDLPATVAELVMRATAQHPGDRFAGASEMGTALARCIVELGAPNKVRAVTGALSALPAFRSDVPGAFSAPVYSDGLPELVDPSDGSSTSAPEIALTGSDLLEPSATIPSGSMPGAQTAGDTAPMSLPIPPEAFQPQTATAKELFDRGLRLRVEGHGDLALETWERALALAPENLVYQAYVHRLREELGNVRKDWSAIPRQ